MCSKFDFSRSWIAVYTVAASLLTGHSNGLAAAKTPANGVVTSSEKRGASLAAIARRCTRQVTLEWRVPSHGLVATEELVADGANWSRYRLTRDNLTASFEARRHGDAIDLVMQRGDGKPPQRKKFLGVSTGVLVGPALAVYLHDNLAILHRGSPLDFDFLVVDHALILGLRARPIDYGTDGSIRVKVEASSPLMRPFVPTTTMIFAPDGKLSSLSGMLPLQDGTPRQPISLEGTVTFGVEAGDIEVDDCRLVRPAA